MNPEKSNNKEQNNQVDETQVSREDIFLQEPVQERRETHKIQMSKELQSIKTGKRQSKLQKLKKLTEKQTNEVDEVESLLFIFARFFLQTSSSMKRQFQDSRKKESKPLVNYMDHIDIRETNNQLFYEFQMDFMQD